jgi:4-hydroxy-2-oxoheptanedioate aldolase
LRPFALYRAWVRVICSMQLPEDYSADRFQDMVFIGPNDLALSLLGYVPARGDEPEFIMAIDRIVAAARKHGKWVARLSSDGDSCKEHLRVFDTVALSYDVRAIQNWYTAELRHARS